jgi:ABC-2 type transport system ATP-binding protein
MNDSAIGAVDAAIKVDAITKRYGRTLALDGVSLEVRPGELFALLGPNGAGKTTLIHILCTILAPDGGTARVWGYDVATQPLQARKRLGVVFQEPSLDDRLTVHENLNFHGLVYGVPAAIRRKRIEEVLALVELTEWRDKLARVLSSGMKRRLEIARALVHDSRILFLDEPTVGLDPQTRERIWHYLRRLKNERALTVIITTHYIEEVDGCDRVCVIDRGKILALDTPGALKAKHGQALVRVIARDEAVAAEIIAQYPDTLRLANGELVVKSEGKVFAEAFVARYADRLRQVSFDQPSLESVFLNLTGRDLRDQEAGARERTFAFGKRGGEHTR